jgi:hypothetical protein
VIIYYGGGGVTGTWLPVNEFLIRRGAARLLTFAYPQMFKPYCELAKALGVRARIMIDSGAYTAWSKGTQIDLEALSAAFARLLDTYDGDFLLVNLDSIPGNKGIDPTPAELKAARRRSQKNFAILNSRFNGKVVPVFHQDEAQEYFDQLVGESEYVALSPRNDVHENFRIDFARFYGERTARKFHGLATTSLPMMQAVKWHSVDSAAWIKAAGYGNIFYRTPDALRVLSISSRSPKRGGVDLHFDNLSPHHRGRVIDTIASKGHSFKDLQNSDVARYMWNARCWMEDL